MSVFRVGDEVATPGGKGTVVRVGKGEFTGDYRVRIPRGEFTYSHDELAHTTVALEAGQHVRIGGRKYVLVIQDGAPALIPL